MLGDICGFEIMLMNDLIEKNWNERKVIDLADEQRLLASHVPLAHQPSYDGNFW